MKKMGNRKRMNIREVACEEEKWMKLAPDCV
jgi:hypothetical protein